MILQRSLVFLVTFVWKANANIKNWKLISAVLVAALYPNVMRVMSLEARIKQSIPGLYVVHVYDFSIFFKINKYCINVMG